MAVYTRSDYLRDCRDPTAFHRYYGGIIADSGGAKAFARRLPRPVADIRAALAEGDVHLNTIPLHLWDRMAVPVSARAAAALRARGDYPTLGGAVCILKEAARILAETPAD